MIRLLLMPTIDNYFLFNKQLLCDIPCVFFNTHDKKMTQKLTQQYIEIDLSLVLNFLNWQRLFHLFSVSHVIAFIYLAFPE